MNAISNAEQYEAWNGESGERWVANADRHDRVFAPVADALFAAARLLPAEHILDIGCGCGATTLRAANVVGPQGTATGLDISRPLLDLARTRAVAQGVANIEFVQGDAQDHVFIASSIDVAIARFGTMFFSNPTAAFTNIARAVRPEGRLCFATWQPLAANEWLTVPGTALLRHAALPSGDPNAPGMFAQSDPAIIESTVAAAGFSDIHCEAVEVDCNFGATVDDAVAHLADSGPGRLMLETISSGPALDAALADVREALQDHVEDDGVHLHSGIWITTATRTTTTR
jgi:SAM-dependent methyltransferase